MTRRSHIGAAAAVLLMLATAPARGAEEGALLKDLTSVIALLALPCGQVVKAERRGDNDYLGNEDGDPHVNAGFRANESGAAGVRNQNDSYENNIFIDGMDANDPMSGKSTTNLSYEAIEEVNVKTAGFEAEYGQSTGGVVNVVTGAGETGAHLVGADVNKVAFTGRVCTDNPAERRLLEERLAVVRPGADARQARRSEHPGG